MSNRELPMMPWFPDQFAASTAGWTFTERAVYRALLDLQWQQGCIFADLLRISQALGVDKRTVQRCWRLVGPKFAAVEGGLQNYRLEQHRLAALELHKKKVAAARVRWDAAHAEHMHTHKQSTSAASVSHMPPSPSPSPSLSVFPNSSGKRAANGKNAAARPTVGGTEAIREDDPDVRRKRREAETLAAQHAAKKDDGMPF